MTMLLVYKQKSQEKMMMLDNERARFRSQYTVAIVISLILFVSLIILFILPYFTIQIHYKDPASITSQDVQSLRGLYAIANGLFILTFVTQQFSSQQGPSDEELEPLSDDDGIDTSEEEDSDLGEDEDGATTTQA